MLAELSISVNDLALIELELNKHDMSMFNEKGDIKTIEEVLDDVKRIGNKI